MASLLTCHVLYRQYNLNFKLLVDAFCFFIERGICNSLYALFEQILLTLSSRHNIVNVLGNQLIKYILRDLEILKINDNDSEESIFFCS